MTTRKSVLFKAAVIFLSVLIAGLGTFATFKVLPSVLDGIYENKSVNLPFSNNTKTPDLPDSEMVVTTLSGKEFYSPPYIPLTPTNEITSVSPTGQKGTFAKEDAILAAKRKGFFKGSSVNSIPSKIRLDKAKNSGDGQAWFVQETDYHASATSCPQPGGGASATIQALFELNQSTGRIVIINTCGVAFFD